MRSSIIPTLTCLPSAVRIKEKNMFIKSKLEEIYRKILFTRHDDDGSIFYFSYTDFPGLKREKYTFKNKHGDTLCGYFYFYDKPISDRIIVFDHGMGAGHRAYMREIEMLAKHGYLVYSYDHTGCTESEGKHILGLSGSLSDLDDCLNALKSEPKLAAVSYSVVGHSWGGFSTMNISAFHPDVKRVVAISGFASLEIMHRQVIPAPLGIFRKHFLDVEKEQNPSYAEISAIKVLSDTNVPTLLIHSVDDPTVSSKENHIKVEYALKANNNVRFVLLKGKKHNPHYTKSAVMYKDLFFKELKKRRKKGTVVTETQKRDFLRAYDWYKMTEQDEAVWKVIFEHLDF